MARLKLLCCMGESSYCMYWTDYERLSDLNLLADDTRSETRLLQCHSRFRENDGINNLVYLCANHNFISDLFKRKKTAFFKPFFMCHHRSIRLFVRCFFLQQFKLFLRQLTHHEHMHLTCIGAQNFKFKRLKHDFIASARHA